MKILVDTSIWSLALRRKTISDKRNVQALHNLINDFRVEIIGAVRQEILSGIKVNSQFNTLNNYLSAFIDLPTETKDYEKAAMFYNLCRSKGIQGSNTDFLICAVAVRTAIPIFTLDGDFKLFSKVLPIKLYKP